MTLGTAVCLAYGALLVAVVAWCRSAAIGDQQARTAQINEQEQRHRQRVQERAARSRLRQRCPDVTPLGGDGWPLLPTDRQPTHDDFLKLMADGHSFR